jgi:hypothetical protein
MQLQEVKCFGVRAGRHRIDHCLMHIRYDECVEKTLSKGK